YVVEELEPFIEAHVKSMGIDIEVENLFSIQGELSANTIYSKITDRTLELDTPPDAPGRPPVSCPGSPQRGMYYLDTKLNLHAGVVHRVYNSLYLLLHEVLVFCPHRGIYYVVKKLKLHAAGDIGCYTLGALPPLEGIDTCICMGASIGMAHG